MWEAAAEVRASNGGDAGYRRRDGAVWILGLMIFKQHNTQGSFREGTQSRQEGDMSNNSDMNN